MTADPVLLLAWLIAAHLIADFVLQTAGTVAAKTSTGGAAARGLLTHAGGVALSMVPVALAFGGSGLVSLAWVVATHLVIDRVKIVMTRSAEKRAIVAANRRHEGRAPAAGLGRAWTPLPAAYFVLDQVAHVAMLVVAWALWLVGAPLAEPWTSTVGAATHPWSADVVHGAALGLAVVGSLVIANVRAGAIFVATLVRPLEAAADLGAMGAAAPVAPSADEAPAAQATAASAAARPARRWSFRLGPLEGRVSEEAMASPAPAESAVVAGERVALPPPAQVGATIGVIERLLIVAFVLVGADAAIGFVVGAKTIARFKQLDDRDFAEYYLLGTLASVSIAVLTAIVARAALDA